MVVGFIGLGAMGRNVALNVRRAGFEMRVYDIRAEAAAPLVEKGARPRRRARRTRSNAATSVVTMVFGPKEIAEVVRGPQGLPVDLMRGNSGST